MSIEEMKKQLYENVLKGDFDLTENIVMQALDEGMDPLKIINEDLVPAIELVGDKFAKKEYYLPDLMISANAMNKAIQILESKIEKSGIERESSGKVVIGSVKGDIHDIGKTIVASLLSAKGFIVEDVGVDVDLNTFINKIVEIDADILAMSALLPITMPYQREVIKELEVKKLRDKIKVMVGGAPVTQEYADNIGADGYADDAVGAVKLAEELMSENNKS